jgi:hypothetical protein
MSSRVSAMIKKTVSSFLINTYSSDTELKERIEAFRTERRKTNVAQAIREGEVDKMNVG